MMAVIKVNRTQVEELKGTIEQGLHMFGRAMNMVSRICEEGEMGERYGMMGERDYPMGERYDYGDRMGRGRYGRY